MSFAIRYLLPRWSRPLALLLLVARLWGWSVGSIQAEPLPRVSTFDLAMADDLPGRYHKGACVPFAKTLYSRMATSGREAHFLIYAWKMRRDGTTGAHAFIVYRDDDGGYWGIDNERSRPLRLGAASPLGWCQAFATGASVSLRVHQSTLTSQQLVLDSASSSATARPPIFLAKRTSTSAVPALTGPPPILADATVNALSMASADRVPAFMEAP